MSGKYKGEDGAQVSTAHALRNTKGVNVPTVNVNSFFRL